MKVFKPLPKIIYFFKYRFNDIRILYNNNTKTPVSVKKPVDGSLINIKHIKIH